MLSSLYSGISGLQANSNAISVVGNNIANSNTIGFKSSSTTFADLLYQNISSGSGTSQVGRGTTVSTINTNFAQGSFQTTESATDLAIGGDGFFIVKTANSDTAYYTRAGQFEFDKEGNLTNSEGYVLQGRAIDPTTNTPTGVATDIIIPQGLSQPNATETIGMAVNLNSEATPDTYATGSTWDFTTGGQTQAGTFDTSADSDDLAQVDYSSSITVYDSLGQAHVVNVYFKKDATADATSGETTWNWIATADFGEEDQETIGGSGQLVFSNEGLLKTEKTTTTTTTTTDPDTGETTTTTTTTTAEVPTDGTATFTFPGATDQEIHLDFGSDSGGGASTQYTSASTTTFQTQDGYAPGELESITVSEDGTISGHYSNGQILNLFQITLANFNNSQGLHKEGGNLYTETVESGVAYTNSPGKGALGEISANSLEQSNVDLATEFVNLIVCQRGYQANSRVITTTDQMLDELMNLKR